MEPSPVPFFLFSSCGNLLSENGFLHPRRILDTHVLIFVLKGTLLLTQGDIPYEVKENHFLLLLPHTLHFGTAPSTGSLSYYWVHFQPCDTARDQSIPIFSSLPSASHSFVFFHQLLDLAKREQYRPTLKCHYALNLLLLELTTESHTLSAQQACEMPPRLSDCISWIQLHYTAPLCAQEIADRFGYNPCYLTQLFKRHTGFGLQQYINHLRIVSAKNLLATPALTIEAIAMQCGFPDVKYFYRVFKRSEGITPTEYRHLFQQKKIVR